MKPLRAVLRLGMCALPFLVCAHVSAALAETLRDVLGSRAMHKVELATEKSRKQHGRVGREDRSWYNGMDPQSNFALIWSSTAGSNQLFNWIGAALPQYKLTNLHNRRYCQHNLVAARRARDMGYTRCPTGSAARLVAARLVVASLAAFASPTRHLALLPSA